MEFNKIKGVAPHKAPPIIRWIGAYPSGTYSLENQIQHELKSTCGKSAEALKALYRGSQSSWYSLLAERTGIGLVVDMEKTPLHRCYFGDVGTDRGYENSKNVPLVEGYRSSVSFVSKYKQIWNGVSTQSHYSYDECVIGNGKNPIRYQAVICHKDREAEAKQFAEAMGLPLYVAIRDNGKVRLDSLGYLVKDYFSFSL